MIISDELVTIGRILRARGIKGEVAVAAEMDLSTFPEVLAGERWLALERVWKHGEKFVVKFRGVDSVADAELLAGATLYIPKDRRPPAAAGEYYYSDLVGCELFDRHGARLGVITGWEEYGAAPLLTVDANGQELLIPFAQAICIEIDLAAHRVVIDPPEGLLDLNRP